MTSYVIWDLDNCLADDSRRIPMIDWHLSGDARYERYHRLAIHDPVGRDSFAVFRTFILTQTVPIFITGRPEKFRKDTIAWLQESLLFEALYDKLGAQLFMRKDGDARKSVEIKRQIVEHLSGFIDLKDIFVAFDDHQPIVDMYKSFGIPASQLKIHDISAYHNPMDKEEPGNGL